MSPSWIWNIKLALLHPNTVKSPDTHCAFCSLDCSYSIDCSNSVLDFFVANAMLSPNVTIEPTRAAAINIANIPTL